MPVYLKTWNGAVLRHGEEDGPVTVSRTPERAMRFYMTVERSGSEAAARETRRLAASVPSGGEAGIESWYFV